MNSSNNMHSPADRFSESSARSAEMKTITKPIAKKKVTIVQTPKQKQSAWAMVKVFLCGMSDGTVLHGEKIQSIPDLVNFENKTGIFKKK